jgi:hypothetical protein
MADPQIGERFEDFHMRVAEGVGSVLGPNTGMSAASPRRARG